jgi:hypothetical protein
VQVAARVDACGALWVGNEMSWRCHGQNYAELVSNLESKSLSLSLACSLARFMLQGCYLGCVHSTVEKIKHIATQALHPLEFLVYWKRYS